MTMQMIVRVIPAMNQGELFIGVQGNTRTKAHNEESRARLHQHFFGF